MNSPYMHIHSPFSDNRWEDEFNRRFYFLNYKEYHMLTTTSKHVFLVGHRGTGKTTLLKALSWQERLHNPSLMKTLNNDPFADGIIGCFLNFRQIGLAAFEAWLYKESDPIYHLILTAYLRFYWLELATHAAQRVLERKKERLPLRQEQEALRETGASVSLWLRNSQYRPPSIPPGPFDVSLSTLEHLFAAYRDYMFADATFATQAPSKIAALLNLNRIQDLANLCVQEIIELIGTAFPDQEWTFRVCMDESEFLTDRARLSLRSLVRECESPLLLVISALSTDELGVDTVHRDVKLQRADRLVISLDARSTTDFQILLQGIVNERISEWLGQDQQYIDLRTLLGEFSLDTLLLSSPSEAPAYLKYKYEWAEWLRTHNRKKRETEDGPLFQHMLENNWVKSTSDLGPLRRSTQSSGARKLFVAAYFDQLNHLGVASPTYAGWNMVAELFDNSLRDALRFLDTCYEDHLGRMHADDEPSHRPENLKRFARSSPLAIQYQDEALRAIGRKKFEEDLEFRIQVNGDKAARIIQFFGRLSNKINYTWERAAESACFVVKDQRSDYKNEFKMLVECLEACNREGFIRIEVNDSKTGTVRFRIHRSLARYFGFSYRKPLYSRMISNQLVSRVWSATDLTNFANLAHDAAIALRRSDPRPSVVRPDQLDLFNDTEVGLSND